MLCHSPLYPFIICYRHIFYNKKYVSPSFLNTLLIFIHTMVKRGSASVSVYQITSFYYEDHHANKTILFLHGWNASYQTLLPLKLDLDDYNQLFIDLPGCGYQPEPERPYTIQDYIDLIESSFKEECDKIEWIVGHSFGGKLAVKMAKKMPHLKGLFLISPAILKTKRGIKYHFKTLQYKFYKKMHWNTNQFGSEDYKQASPLMKQTLVRIVNEDAKKEIKEISIPTLLIWGKNDTATPLKMGYQIKKAMKDCALIPLEGGHFAYLSQIQYVKEILKCFIKEGKN